MHFGELFDDIIYCLVPISKNTYVVGEPEGQIQGLTIKGGRLADDLLLAFHHGNANSLGGDFGHKVDTILIHTPVRTPIEDEIVRH